MLGHRAEEIWLYSDRKEVFMRVLKVLGVLALFLLMSAGQGYAQGRWGVGAFANYNVPTFGLGNWYSSAGQYGMNFAYVPTSNVTVEVEFHRSTFTHGSLETRTFTWTDGKAYASPNAKSSMSFNSFLVNGLIRLSQHGEPFSASSYAPYIEVGGGFYHYRNNVSGLLWPGQTGALVTELEPFSDRRYALGFNAGFGVEAFVINNVSVDLRARYNFLIGQTRPMEDWGLKETLPLQLFDIGAGIKFYFSGK
jgi:opacity protein-like surface antigen